MQERNFNEQKIAIWMLHMNGNFYIDSNNMLIFNLKLIILKEHLPKFNDFGAV